MFRRISALSLRKPHLVLVLWALGLATLGLISLNVEHKLRSSTLRISGTQSDKVAALEERSFGHIETMAVVIEAKKNDQKTLKIATQKTVKALDQIEGINAIDPWKPSTPKYFRKNNQALIMVQCRVSFLKAQDLVQKVRDATNKGTVGQVAETHIIGTPVFAQELHDTIVKATERAEHIAAPLLVIILFLIFRSVFAALLPLVLGLCVTTIGKGILTLIGSHTLIDTVALSTMSVLGLALGVDYSLLIVSRFREELRKPNVDTANALRATTVTAGRTVAVAGIIVTVGLGLTVFTLPGVILFSACMSSMLAALLSVFAASSLLPALLLLIGPRIDALSLARKAEPHPSRVSRLVRRITRRPWLATIFSLIPLLILTAPVSGLKTGPPDSRMLPKDNRLNKDIRSVEANFGKGWLSPYTILLVSKDGPITDTNRLAEINKAQQEIIDKGNASIVIGPSVLSPASKKISKNTRSGPKQLAGLANGIDQTDTGLSQLRLGLLSARNGASVLASSNGQTLSGSQQLSAGLAQASSSLGKLSSGLSQIHSGSNDINGAISELKSGTNTLHNATSKAASRASKLAAPVAKFQSSLSSNASKLNDLSTAASEAEASLKSAKSALDSAASSTKDDPQYQAAYSDLSSALSKLSGVDPNSGSEIANGYTSVSSLLNESLALSQDMVTDASSLVKSAGKLTTGLNSINNGASKLSSGTTDTLSGAKKLGKAIRTANSGTKQLRSGANQLVPGADKLTSGLSSVSKGSLDLSEGLNSGYKKSKKLQTGVKEIGHKLHTSRRNINQTSTADTNKTSARQEKINRNKFANSGYLTLAALASSSKQTQQEVQYVVNASRGGTSARITVIPAAFSIDHPELTEELNGIADRLGRKINSDAEVGGAAVAFQDYDKATQSKQLPIILLLSTLTLLFLIVVFRSILLAVKAVILNLLVVGSAFGVLAFINQSSNSLFGGAGFIDAIVFFMVYAVVFTLSMDYEIFMINRMRESYQKLHSTEEAVNHGIDRSATVVTGAAAIMVTVFLSFAIFGIGNVRQLGTALSVAVILDATIVRLVLLPATMRLFGKANWWLPKWLDRNLPKLDT